MELADSCQSRPKLTARNPPSTSATHGPRSFPGSSANNRSPDTPIPQWLMLRRNSHGFSVESVKIGELGVETGKSQTLQSWFYDQNSKTQRRGLKMFQNANWMWNRLSCEPNQPNLLKLDGPTSLHWFGERQQRAAEKDPLPASWRQNIPIIAIGVIYIYIYIYIPMLFLSYRNI